MWSEIVVVAAAVVELVVELVLVVPTHMEQLLLITLLKNQH